MISVDTNILLYAYNQDCPEHGAAAGLLTHLSTRDDVAICELVLVELYQLVRNPAVLREPLDAPAAASLCQAFRGNPRWAVLDCAPIMEKLWSFAAKSGVARRRLFDARLAFSLRHHGVQDFATRNVKDFQGFGFDRVWDPVVDQSLP